MSVKVPVLAASGVASVTVTVAAGSVSDASDRRLRVYAILLLPAAATVASAAAAREAAAAVLARAAVSMVMMPATSLFVGGARAATAAATVATRPTLSWPMAGCAPRMAVVEGSSVAASGITNTAATSSNVASNGMGLRDFALLYVSPPSASAAVVGLVVPAVSSGVDGGRREGAGWEVDRKGCGEVYK